MERIPRKRQHLGASHADSRPRSPQGLSPQAPARTDKSGPVMTSKDHSPTLDSPLHTPATLFDFIQLYGYIPSPSSTHQPIDNAFKQQDCSPPRLAASPRELINSTRFPWPPSPSRTTAPSAFPLCPSCNHSPLEPSTTSTTSYYTPRV